MIYNIIFIHPCIIYELECTHLLLYMIYNIIFIHPCIMYGRMCAHILLCIYTLHGHARGNRIFTYVNDAIYDT